MSDSSLTRPSSTPSPPTSPTFWKGPPSPPLATKTSQPEQKIQQPAQPLTTRSGRAIKRSPKALAASASEPPRKKAKMNVSAKNPTPPPSPPTPILPKFRQQSPLSHLSPPFEKFWDIDAPLPPILSMQQEQRPPHALLTGDETLYFAYGKDMDLTYLIRKFQSDRDIKFIAVGKLSGFRWVIGCEARFPKIVKGEEGEEEAVWGLVYQCSEKGLEILRLKAEKRGLVMREGMEVSMFEKTGLPGFWNAPLLPVGSAAVNVMVGEWSVEDEVGSRERKLEGNKKRKVNGGILWASSEGLLESWKRELRKWVEEPKCVEESGYWGGCEGKEGKRGVRPSGGLRGGKGNRRRGKCLP